MLVKLLAVIAVSAVALRAECGAPSGVINLQNAAQDNLWRGKVMRCPAKIDASVRTWSGTDFFESEFGEPCGFATDLLKDYGFASGPYQVGKDGLSFSTGEKGFSFGFGVEPGKMARPAIRLGVNWALQSKDLLRLRMEVEQNVPETEWEFACAKPEGLGWRDTASRFKISGEGMQPYETDLGMVRQVLYSAGFKFTCKTPGAQVKIKSLKLAPSSAEVFFRKTFELAELPVKAHCSFQDGERYSFYVNGKLVASGSGVEPAYIKNVDLKPFLKKGRNVIAFEREWLMWAGVAACKPELLFEGVAVDRGGVVTRLLGDGSWRCALKREVGWQEPGFDASSWLKPELSDRTTGARTTTEETADGKIIFNGINPKFMGSLDVAPWDRQYPVFLPGEPVAFKAKLPLGVKPDAAISLTVCAGGSNEVVEKLEGRGMPDAADFAVWRFDSKIAAPGPYRLIWRLDAKHGELKESREEEFVIAGPIKQDEVALADFENNFEARLRLVEKFDCTSPVPLGKDFADHSGMYGAPAAGKGRVVEANGLKYRETGAGRWDWFGYRLHLADLGAPYLAEVIVPDDKDRYVYSGITESYPVSFRYNVPKGSTGWYTATGTCYTGVRYPLSGGTKKLRYVFFPGSANAAIVVMSGFDGDLPAAACEINIYKIEGGLPALAIPASERLFGSHNERLSTMRLTCGMSESPLEFDKTLATSPHRNVYFNWYQMLARKISLLRFQGYNMSIEGLFMYNNGEYPGSKHCSVVGDGADVDPVDLMIKMYNQNKIKLLFGFEYIVSPQIYVEGLDGVSDRRMWRGEKSTRLVDRHGRQMFGYSNSGFNFLEPDVARVMLDCVADIRRKYERSGDVAGLFLVEGGWWLPSFNAGTYGELDDLEVGYDDVTIGLFEKELGLDLGVAPNDAARFQKRYDAITRGHLQDFLAWRLKKAEEFHGRIAAKLGNGDAKWKLYHFPTPNLKQSSPFIDLQSRRSERDAYAGNRFRQMGVPVDSQFGEGDSQMVFPLGCWSKFRNPQEDFDWVYGWNKNVTSKKLLERLGAFYVGIGVTNGLDEIDSPATLAKDWIFQRTTRGVFTPRAAGDNAMNEFVDGVMCPRVPKLIVDQWLDCNLETGFGEQLRRFAKSFYVTPDLLFKRLPKDAAKGVFAQTAKYPDGSLCLRLINNTPFPAAGFIEASASSMEDLVYDRNLEGGKSRLELGAFDIRIIKLVGVNGDVKADFSFDGRTTRDIENSARFILQQEDLLKDVPGDKVAALFDALARGDAYALWTNMDDYDVLAPARAAIALLAALKKQGRFSEALEKTGVGRIDCGAESAYVDKRGREWLPDQAFATPAAYGRVGGCTVNRGDIAIKDETAPGVYRTEAYGGQLAYSIPLPPGKYDVRLHFAETYIGCAKPDLRLFSVKIGGRMIAERMDIFAKTGALNTPCVVEAKELSPAGDGILKIEFFGNPCVNGIEVEKRK